MFRVKMPQRYTKYFYFVYGFFESGGEVTASRKASVCSPLRSPRLNRIFLVFSSSFFYSGCGAATPARSGPRWRYPICGGPYTFPGSSSGVKDTILEGVGCVWKHEIAHRESPRILANRIFLAFGCSAPAYRLRRNRTLSGKMLSKKPACGFFNTQSRFLQNSSAPSISRFI